MIWTKRDGRTKDRGYTTWRKAAETSEREEETYNQGERERKCRLCNETRQVMHVDEAERERHTTMSSTIVGMRKSRT